MRIFVKALRNSVVGLLGIYLFNLLSMGMQLNLSVLNSVFVGVLGIPGFATLIILKFMGMAV